MYASSSARSIQGSQTRILGALDFLLQMDQMEREGRSTDDGADSPVGVHDQRELEREIGRESE